MPPQPPVAGQRPLSDPDYDLSHIIKLRSESDWIRWSHDLKIALDLINRGSWEIVNGNRSRPSEPKYTVTTAEEVKRDIARRERIPVRRVTQQELNIAMHDIAQENSRRRERYETRLERWEDENWRALVILRSTIAREPLSYLHEIKEAREAYLRLLYYYGDGLPNTIMTWTNWTKIRFEPGMSHMTFLLHWNNALQELVLLADVPPFLQFMQFVAAMEHNEGASKFLEAPFPEDAENSTEELYKHFLACYED